MSRKPTSSKWNRLTLRDEALKYDTRQEFTRYSTYAAAEARRLGIMDALFPPLPPGPRATPWNEVTLSILADQCRNRTEFARKYRTAYNAAVKLNLLNKLFPPKAAPTLREFYAIPEWLK